MSWRVRRMASPVAFVMRTIPSRCPSNAEPNGTRSPMFSTTARCTTIDRSSSSRAVAPRRTESKPSKNGVVGTRRAARSATSIADELWLENSLCHRARKISMSCAEAQGVAIESGDIVLVRTGMMTRCLAEGLLGGLLRWACSGPLGALFRLALRTRNCRHLHRYLGNRGPAQRDRGLFPASPHDFAAQHGCSLR